MRKRLSELNSKKQLWLKVDDSGRITLSKEIQDRLGIEPGDEIPATLEGSVLEVNPKPSTKLEAATTGRDNWQTTTPTDAGTALFGRINEQTKPDG